MATATARFNRAQPGLLARMCLFGGRVRGGWGRAQRTPAICGDRNATRKRGGSLRSYVILAYASGYEHAEQRHEFEMRARKTGCDCFTRRPFQICLLRNIEIRKTKSETNSKCENTNVPNECRGRDLATRVSVIGDLEFRFVSDFDIRVSNGRNRSSSFACDCFTRRLRPIQW